MAGELPEGPGGLGRPARGVERRRGDCGDGSAADQPLVEGLAVDDGGLLLDGRWDVELVREPVELRHRLGEVPVDRGVDPGPDLPLPQAEHLELGLEGDLPAEGVPADPPDHGGEALVVDREGQGHSDAAPGLLLGLGEGPPLGALVDDGLGDDEAAVPADDLPGLLVMNDVAAPALGAHVFARVLLPSTRHLLPQHICSGQIHRRTFITGGSEILVTWSTILPSRCYI